MFRWPRGDIMILAGFLHPTSLASYIRATLPTFPQQRRSPRKVFDRLWAVGAKTLLSSVVPICERRSTSRSCNEARGHRFDPQKAHWCCNSSHFSSWTFSSRLTFHFIALFHKRQPEVIHCSEETAKPSQTKPNAPDNYCVNNAEKTSTWYRTR